jgi:hypothetical protein
MIKKFGIAIMDLIINFQLLSQDYYQLNNNERNNFTGALKPLYGPITSSILIIKRNKNQNVVS